MYVLYIRVRLYCLSSIKVGKSSFSFIKETSIVYPGWISPSLPLLGLGLLWSISQSINLLERFDIAFYFIFIKFYLCSNCYMYIHSFDFIIYGVYGLKTESTLKDSFHFRNIIQYAAFHRRKCATERFSLFSANMKKSIHFRSPLCSMCLYVRLCKEARIKLTHVYYIDKNGETIKRRSVCSFSAETMRGKLATSKEKMAEKRGKRGWSTFKFYLNFSSLALSYREWVDRNLVDVSGYFAEVLHTLWDQK